MVSLAIADLPTTQFTVGVIAKSKGCTLGEAREALDKMVDQGKLTRKVAGSGARNYKLPKNAANAKRAGSPATKKKAAPVKKAAAKTSAPKGYPDGSQEQYDAAKTERTALKRWESGGKKGRKPATPNYDAIQAAYEAKQANGGKAPRKARAKKAGTSTDSTPRGTTVRFVIDGRIMPDSQNKLSSVAWYHSKGVGGEDVARISVTELRDLLAAEGVTDPGNTTGWKVTLPNGKVVETQPL